MGETLVRVDTPKKWADRGRRLQGARVARVEARGKHLVLRTDGRYTVHCHAMMYGSWQFGEPGMALRKEEKDVRLRLRTPDREAVFFHGPIMEILEPEELEGHRHLSSLGPDVLDPDFDRREAWRRLRAEPGRPVGAVVLDQRVVAGIGNIFKSEGLHLARIDPRRDVGDVSRVEMDRAWRVTGALMRWNVDRDGPIVTLPPELREDGRRNWVYRRRGRPCLTCGETVQMVRQGRHDRTTYFCPGCQR